MANAKISDCLHISTYCQLIFHPMLSSPVLNGCCCSSNRSNRCPILFRTSLKHAFNCVGDVMTNYELTTMWATKFQFNWQRNDEFYFTNTILGMSRNRIEFQFLFAHTDSPPWFCAFKIAQPIKTPNQRMWRRTGDGRMDVSSSWNEKITKIRLVKGISI